MALPYTSSFDETIKISDTCFQLHITTGVVTTITVPGTSNQKFNLLFGLSSNANVFVGQNATPAIPATDTATNDENVEFVTPDMKRFAIGGDEFSFISPDADAYIGVSIRQIPN
jgi:hypothetical protein